MTTESSPEEKPESGYLADVVATDTSESQPADAKTEAAPSSDADAKDAKPEAPTSFLEAVKAAAKAEPKDADPSSKVETKPDQAKPAEGAKPDAAEVVDDSTLPFHKHPRFQQLTKDLREQSERVKALEVEKTNLASEAEVGRRFVSEIQARGIQPQEFQEGFEIMGLMVSDPAEARRRLQVHMDRLGSFTGDVLAPDLREQVENGEITERAAREMQTLRAVNARTSATSQAQAEQRTRETQQSAHQKLMADVTSAGDAWYTAKQAQDPDWEKKQPLVIMATKALISERGFPPDAATATKWLNEALATVDAQTAMFRPKVQATPKPVTGGASGSNNPVPKSMREAMELAARKVA